VSPVQATFGMREGQTPLRFKIFGIGGAGCNLVSISSSQSVAIGSSQKEVDKSRNSKKIVFSSETMESYASTDISVLTPNMIPSEIRNEFFDLDISVFFAGLGGETGSSGIRFLSSVGKVLSKPSISVVSMPFSVESITRREIADSAVADLRKRSDFVIRLENDKLMKLVPNLPIDKVFKVMNAIMERPITDLSKVMVQTDIAMMRQISTRSDCFRLGVGLGRGPNRDLIAIKEAFGSPWFDFNIESTETAFLIISSYPLDQKEVNGIIKDVHAKIFNSKLMFGSYEDSSLGDRLRITLLIGPRLSV